MTGSILFVLGAAASVPVYWALPPRVRPGYLALVSLALLVPLDPTGVGWLAGCALLVGALAPITPRHGAIAAALVAGLLLQLAWFKYLPASGDGASAPESLALPLGLSYLTFRLVHYVVETWRGQLPPRSWPTYLSWALFFPVFTAGPIERFDHFVENRATRLDREDLAHGLTRIAHGLVKKFVLAEAFVDALSDPGPDAGPLALWTRCGAAFLWVYLDFSAYSDFAIGAARLFGIRVAENFRWPLLATSPSDFWARWHMTLVSWCRDYVYFPLVGKVRNAYVGIVALWITLALWHAATLPWIAWGLWHAAGVIVHRRWARRRRPAPVGVRAVLHKVLAGAATFLFVTASFAFTVDRLEGGAATSGELADALDRLARMFLLDTEAGQSG